MKFIIDQNIFEQFPELKIGILVTQGVTNTDHPREIETLLRQAETEVRARPEIEVVNEYPLIASWREVHRKFGSNPKEYPPSIQALIKRVIKGGQLPTINPLVDLYNYSSLKYIIPAGGEDLDQCVGEIILTYAKGDEVCLSRSGVQRTIHLRQVKWYTKIMPVSSAENSIGARLTELN